MSQAADNENQLFFFQLKEADSTCKRVELNVIQRDEILSLTIEKAFRYAGFDKMIEEIENGSLMRGQWCWENKSTSWNWGQNLCSVVTAFDSASESSSHPKEVNKPLTFTSQEFPQKRVYGNQ